MSANDHEIQLRQLNLMYLKASSVQRNGVLLDLLQAKGGKTPSYVLKSKKTYSMQTKGEKTQSKDLLKSKKLFNTSIYFYYTSEKAQKIYFLV